MKIIRIVGSGVEGIRHLTQEAIENIFLCKKALILGSITGMKEFLEENNILYEDMTDLYINNQIDNINYSNIKSKIMSELEIHGDISFLIQGHPRLGVSVVQELQCDALVGACRLIVTPGISSFDTMINDLMLDPIESGTSLLDVNRLILFDYCMEPCINYFLYHVCSIGNQLTNYMSPTAKNGVHFLKEKLLKHYDQNQPVTLIASSLGDGQVHRRIDGTVGSIDILLNEVKFDYSLFIPAISPNKSNLNEDFYNYILS